MTKYWFTWGFGQGHDNCYTIIEVPEGEDSYMVARLHMNRVWGRKWGFQYTSAEDAGVEEYSLRRIQ